MLDNLTDSEMTKLMDDCFLPPTIEQWAITAHGFGKYYDHHQQRMDNHGDT